MLEQVDRAAKRKSGASVATVLRPLWPWLATVVADRDKARSPDGKPLGAFLADLPVVAGPDRALRDMLVLLAGSRPLPVVGQELSTPGYLEELKQAWGSSVLKLPVVDRVELAKRLVAAIVQEGPGEPPFEKLVTVADELGAEVRTAAAETIAAAVYRQQELLGEIRLTKDWVREISELPRTSWVGDVWRLAELAREPTTAPETVAAAYLQAVATGCSSRLLADLIGPWIAVQPPRGLNLLHHALYRRLAGLSDHRSACAAVDGLFSAVMAGAFGSGVGVRFNRFVDDQWEDARAELDRLRALRRLGPVRTSSAIAPSAIAPEGTARTEDRAPAPYEGRPGPLSEILRIVRRLIPLSDEQPRRDG
jgi:hypothetical protein